MRKSFLAGSAALAALSAMDINSLNDDAAFRRVKNAGGGGDDEDEAKALAKSISELGRDLKARDEAMTEAIGKAEAEAKAAGKLSEETQAKLKDFVEKSAEMLGRLTELEQKAARSTSGGGMGGGSIKSLGEQFAESDDVVTFLKSGQAAKGRAGMRVKAITSATADANGSAGALLEPLRIPGIIAPPDRELRVRGLITPGRTSSSSIEYVQETGFTNNAAMVAETAQKPESTMKFAEETTPVRTMAHWVHASKQILDDVPQLVSYIDARLRYGLALVEDAQLLLGDGTGQNLLGIIPQATAFDESRRKAGDTKIDTLRRAMTQARLAQYPVSGFVMHPNDWEDIELTKTDDGAYLFANPQGLAGPTLWGRPVVETDAMPEGEFLTGAFRLGAQVFDREDANVEISTEDRDNFIKNMITIRAEERLALAVYRPEAFITGEFDAG
jgi:HK97 family phage major capsid protein